VTWANSTRSARLPKDWHKRRQQAKRRAKGMCQAKVHEPDCDGIGTECDHVQRGDDHSLTNLQWLSTPCHMAKTKAEAAAGRAAAPKAKRQPEQHPGLI
jgi:hypothetical protein